MANADMDQRTLDASDNDELFSVWAGRGPNLQRMAANADGLLLLTHERGEAGGAWKLAMPEGTSTGQLLQILAALHDHCAQQNLVAPRTWKAAGEQQGQPQQPQQGRKTGTREISIPLTDPDVARKLQEALSPSVVTPRLKPPSADIPE
jgi:hypothetical protein